MLLSFTQTDESFYCDELMLPDLFLYLIFFPVDISWVLFCPAADASKSYTVPTGPLKIF